MIPMQQKAADIMALNLHTPQHATVFCIDEKSAIQALDRKRLTSAVFVGLRQRQGLNSVRQGTLLLLAALNPQNGSMMGKPPRPDERGVCRLPRRSGRDLAARSTHSNRSRKPQRAEGSARASTPRTPPRLLL